MSRSISILLIFSLGSVVASFFLAAPELRAQSLQAELPAPGNFEPETMTRGPLHEAFAEQVNYDAQPGVTVRKPPPEPIEELPPDVRPEGNNIQWIPGYWAWDDDRDDFIWVSGVWRDVPPDRRWMPGYWAQLDEGYQWIAGFWNLDNANQVEYLPYPPNSLERGPTSPQPTVSHYWVSGCWQYQDQRYLWRPGFWNGYREDWVWTPAHYIWTPRGAIYIRGYWDYPLARRGVLFAPVYFPHYANYRRQYHYSPSVVIDLSHVLYHLFVQPGHHHYYWGDYYGDRYRRSGYQANFAFHGRGGYDPLFNYYNTQHRRQGIDYSARLRDWHISQEQHQDRRPPRTWNQQQALVARVGNNPQSGRQLLAQPLRDVINDSHSGVKFRQVDSDQRQALGRGSNEQRDLSQHRRSSEASSPATSRTSGDLARQSDRSRFDGDRGSQPSPPAFARRESARKPAAPQPNRTPPQDRTQRTPGRSTELPAAQHKPRHELSQSSNQQRAPRQVETPSPQPSPRPSSPSRQPNYDSSRVPSAPRFQAKPETSRQFTDRARQDNASTPRFVPHAKPAAPAASKPPSFRSAPSQARPESYRSGRSNAPSARSSGHSQRSAPASREKDHGGRSKR